MQFGPGLLGGEPPINGRALGISALLIGVHLPSERRYIRQAAIETLPVQHTEFDFGHIQPAAMFGRVVKL